MKTGTKKHYAGVLDIPAKKLRGVEVRRIVKPAGTTMQSGNLRTAIFGQQIDKLVFTEETIWHELSEKGRGVWMTDYPIEQRQADELIGRSNGRVLVGGLGLGYAVVALAARPKIREIVVVEQNEAIINLVWKATVKQVAKLYPDRKVTLTVVHADLFDYLKARQAYREKTKRKKPEFNWGYFDIWQGDGESTFHDTVVPLRQLAHGIVTTVVCWNEDIMRGQLYQGLETRLMMVKRPKEFGEQVSLDRLTADTESIYQKWAVPFWRWYQDHQKEDDELIRLVMKLYVKTYGRPEASNGLPALRPYRAKTQSEIVALAGEVS